MENIFISLKRFEVIKAGKCLFEEFIVCPQAYSSNNNQYVKGQDKIIKWGSSGLT